MVARYHLLRVFICAYLLILYVHISFARLVFATEGPIRHKDVEIKSTILIFLTTHASTSHLAFLRTRWPDLLNQTQLLRKADVTIFSTGDPALNSKLTAPFSHNPNCIVINVPNPGYQAGSNLAMSWAVNTSAFDSYDWVVRLNPDVLVLNDTWLHESMRKKDVDAIFVDCRDKCSIGNCTSPRSKIHTDFFAIRPRVLRKSSFNSTTFERIGNAESVATFEFRDVLNSGRHRWLPGAGPMKGICRVRGDRSPVVHTHQLLPDQKKGKYVGVCFREEANANLTKNRTVSMANFYGRLGNRISAVSKLVAFAESAGCDVALPRDLLDGWKSSHREWIWSGPEVRKRSDSYEFCPERGGKEWFLTGPLSAPVCHLQLLQAYFGINSTHVFDRQCLTQNHVALHVRSGDITAGSWDNMGRYQSAPAKKGWSSHSLFPTSYYTSVIRNTRARRGHSTIFYVFCEDHGNPTCVFFQKLSSLDEKIVMRVGKELIDDLHLMLCASEIAESRGTFRLVFRISRTVQVIHTFVDKPIECVDENPQHSSHEIKNFKYWLKLAGDRNTYNNLMREWRNGGFQRHTMDAHYEIESCWNTLQLENDTLFSQRRSDVKLGVPL